MISSSYHYGLHIARRHLLKHLRKLSEYTLSDGIHPTTAGSVATAQAMWAEMQKVNFFGTTIKYGNYNNDGSVNALDFSAFKKYLMNPERTYTEVLDLNCDKTVNAIDFAIMKQYLLGNKKFTLQIDILL